MKTNKLLSFVVGASMLVFFAAPSAFAQGMQSRQQPLKSEPRAGATQQKAAFENHRVSQLMDKTVKDAKGEMLGKVKDLVIGSDGELSYVVISGKDVPGDKLAPIPFTEGNWQFEQNALIVNHIDKNTLEKAPTISANDWQKLNSSTFETEVHGYYDQFAAGQRTMPQAQKSMPLQSQPREMQK